MKTLQYAPEDAEVEQRLYRQFHALHIPQGCPLRVHSVGSRPHTQLQDEDTRLVRAFMQALQDEETKAR